MSWLTCWISWVFVAGAVGAVEGHDVGVEIADAFDLEHAGVAAGEAHRDLVFIVELFLEILDVEDQPLIGPFRRAFVLEAACR